MSFATDEDAPMPGEWVECEKEDGAQDIVPGWDKERLPEEEPSATDEKPEIDPTYQYCFKASLVPYFERLTSTSKPSRRDIIYDKNAFLREEGRNFGDQEPLIVMNNNCVVRTTKAGLEKSLEDRAREDREFESSFRGRGRGRGGPRGRGGRGGSEGGFSRRGYEERGNPNEVKLGDRQRRPSSSSRQRSRSPLLPSRGRHDSSQDVWARPRSPATPASGRRDSSRDSFGVRERGESFGHGNDRRDSFGARDVRERRESFGHGNDRRDSFGGQREERRQSFGGERKDSFRSQDSRDSFDGGRGRDSYQGVNDDRRGSFGGRVDDRRSSFGGQNDDRRGSFGGQVDDRRASYGGESHSDREEQSRRDRYSSGGDRGRQRDDSFSRDRRDSSSHSRHNDDVFVPGYDNVDRPGPRSEVHKVSSSPAGAASSYAEWKRMRARAAGGGQGV